MSPTVLIAGLKFAQEYSLTQKEIETIMPFLKRDYSTSELAKLLNVHKTSLHHIIQRLKLKGLITLKDKDNGNNIYGFSLMRKE